MGTNRKSCPECGYLLNGTESTCPECGYVLYREQEKKPESSQTEPKDSDNSHPNSDEHTRPQPDKVTTSPISTENNESYYHVDFSWFKKFSSDPWLLTLLQDWNVLRWLFAPWHIGGDGKKDVDHAIANDIFFILNRAWKLTVYPEVWAFFKGLPIIIILILFLFPIFGSLFGYMASMLLFLILIIPIISIWLLCIGFGKSCKRYGIPLIRVFRHLCSVFVKSIKESPILHPIHSDL